MYKIQLIFVLLFLAHNSFAQNLLTNPGFENDAFGWNGLWTRTPDAGKAEIVSHPVHSGNPALHIKHWGLEDWSFRPEKKIAVTPGYIYNFSAWVNVESLTGWTDLCITIFDANSEVIDWLYLKKSMDVTNGEYENFSTGFIVPPNVSYVWPRFIGQDSCNLYIDDVEFILIDTVKYDLTYTLENENLEININTIDFSFDITNKVNGENYSTQASSVFNV